jgi:heat shock protein HslJ/uncharacterized membrane protein
MRVGIRLFLVIMILSAGCAGIRNLPEQLAGTYYGYLPCDGCPGILYELRLNPDLTYVEIIRHDEPDGKEAINENNYRMTRDSIIILRGKAEGEGMSHFAVRNGKLEMLSPSGEKIQTGFPERLILTMEKQVFTHGDISDTGFRASGNEPFWGLEIEYGNIIIFKALSAEGFDFKAHYTAPERTSDTSPVKYQGKALNGEFQVTITREECLDTMSGEIFPYSVFVAARRSHRESFRKFEGCGQYLGSYLLNDIWTLDRINDRSIELPNSQKPPVLHIDLPGESVYGYGGCNQFHGSASLVNNRLVMGHIASTKMACAVTQHIEDRFFKAISGKTLDFSIENSTLILGDGMTKLTFVRAD